mmetsp:Transcript_872/g.1158  ORF Transcript_872/g.1158 Transcript_872/m.1158 type:complete len:118 (+) Transcript_872:26-379(+)
MSTGKCILLVSSLSTDPIQVVNTRRLQDAIESKKLLYETIDGSMAESKDQRDRLFSKSTIRKYPQCFIENDGGELEYVGIWDDIESLLDSDSLPADVLAAHPEIKTFTKVFERVRKA